MEEEIHQIILETENQLGTLMYANKRRQGSFLKILFINFAFNTL